MPDAAPHMSASVAPIATDTTTATTTAESSVLSEGDFRAIVARMRDDACERARPQVKAGAAPIRVMARMVSDLIAECHAQGIPEAIIRSEVVNRTIGDIDVRRISATEDGPQYVSIADDLGLALPGEVDRKSVV